MRRTLNLLAVAVTLMGARPAMAQFANRSLGLSVGYMNFANTEPTVEWGLPLSLEASLYIENRFDLTLRVPLMILTEKVFGRQIVATGGNLGVRYLLSEETLRPYVGLDLVYLHIFRDLGTTNFVGLGPNVGLDYFVGDTFTLGARAFVNLYLALNTPMSNAFGGQAVAATYF